ncbi:MAG TPA: hypothetical protein VFH42_08225 [Sporolactobacillaceae bacterium]|nr:hypothetical protein [Sporolactobacillaceae bacterium]
MKWVVNVPKDFKFDTTVKGHGWYRLAPFHYFEEEKKLTRVEELSSGRVVQLIITPEHEQAINVSVEDEELTEQEGTEILKKVRWMFRLDEDLQPFYKRCLELPEMAYVAEEKHGRLLRSSTLFEDFVKVMLTTNTTWNRTISMTALLVEKLGKPLTSHPDQKAFPQPVSIVNHGVSFLKEEIRLGYRSDYIYELALKVTKGELNLEEFLNPDLSTEILIKQLKAIKGIGPYAQSTLLMILGSYDQLPVDSEFRKHVRTKYFKGKDPTSKQIAKLYQKWGNYKYLAYWFDRKA